MKAKRKIPKSPGPRRPKLAVLETEIMEQHIQGKKIAAIQNWLKTEKKISIAYSNLYNFIHRRAEKYTATSGTGVILHFMRLKPEVRDEINVLVRRKYDKFPELRTAIKDVSTLLVAGQARLKVSLGDTFPAMPIPDFSDRPEPLTSDQILTKRKGLGLSQVKFAAELGVSVKKVSAWEHGKAVPDEAEIEKIEKLFNIADKEGSYDA